MTASGLKAPLAGPILDLSHLALIVHIAVFAIDLAIRILCFDFEALVGSLIAVRIRAVIIVLIDLLQYGHRRGVVLMLRIRNVCAQRQQQYAMLNELKRKNIGLSVFC